MEIKIPKKHPSSVKQRLLVNSMAVVIVAFYLFLSLTSAWQKSAYFDETAHIMSGYFMLKYDDYRVNTANMVLGQKLAALPSIISNVNPPSPDLVKRTFSTQYTSGAEAFGLGQVFLNESGNNSQKILFEGRTVMILFGLLTAITVFFWSRKLFGPYGGLISIFFLATCPVFISLSGIVGADIAVTALFLLSTWMFWILLHRVTPFTVSAFGLLAGLLLITKTSSLVFAPVSLILLSLSLLVNRPLAFGWGWRPSQQIESRKLSALTLLASLAASALIVFASIWAGYGFRYSAAPPESTGATLNWQRVLNQQSGNLENPHGPIENVPISFIRISKTSHLFPEAFLFDLANLGTLTKSRIAFFLGETSTNGWFLYFPVAFLAKSGLPMVFALILATLSWLYLSLRPKGETKSRALWSIYDCLPILVFIGVFMVVLITSSINIGHRHMLPIYPFIYIFLGSLVFIFQQAKLWPKILLAAIMMASFWTALSNHPTHLAYISPLFGGPSKGYSLFADSSLEWGQELPAVRKWLDSPSVDLRDRPVYFSYFGSGSPEAEGIHLLRLPGFFDPLQTIPQSCTFTGRLLPGVYLISGTMLQPVYYSRMKGDDFGVDFSSSWCKKHENKYQEMRRCAEEFYTTNNPTRLQDWMRQNRPKILPESQAGEYWMDSLPLCGGPHVKNNFYKR
ncbi:MAG: glycosyltransferase family 39 protein [Victivallales bacterium]